MALYVEHEGLKVMADTQSELLVKLTQALHAGDDLGSVDEHCHFALVAPAAWPGSTYARVDNGLYDRLLAHPLALLYVSQHAARAGDAQAHTLAAQLKQHISQVLASLHARVVDEPENAPLQALWCTLHPDISSQLDNLDALLTSDHLYMNGLGRIVSRSTSPQQRLMHLLRRSATGRQRRDERVGAMSFEIMQQGNAAQQAQHFIEALPNSFLGNDRTRYVLDGGRIASATYVRALRLNACRPSAVELHNMEHTAPVSVDSLALPTELAATLHWNATNVGGAQLSDTLEDSIRENRLSGAAREQWWLDRGDAVRRSDRRPQASSYEQALVQMRGVLQEPLRALGSDYAKLVAPILAPEVQVTVGIRATYEALDQASRNAHLHPVLDAPRLLRARPSKGRTGGKVFVAVEEYGVSGGVPVRLRMWAPLKAPVNAEEHRILHRLIASSSTDGGSSAHEESIQRVLTAGPDDFDARLQEYINARSCYPVNAAMPQRAEVGKMSISDSNRPRPRDFSAVAACVHPRTTWTLNAARKADADAVWLSCRVCGAERLRVVPLHQLPVEHRWSTLAQHPAYLARQRMHDCIDGRAPLNSVKELLHRDGHDALDTGAALPQPPHPPGPVRRRVRA